MCCCDVLCCVYMCEFLFHQFLLFFNGYCEQIIDDLPVNHSCCNVSFFFPTISVYAIWLALVNMFLFFFSAFSFNLWISTGSTTLQLDTIRSFFSYVCVYNFRIHHKLYYALNLNGFSLKVNPMVTTVHSRTQNQAEHKKKREKKITNKTQN